MSAEVNQVKRSLRRWAAGRGLQVDAAGYTLNLDDNLVRPLSTGARVEFEGGDGDELGRGGARGKMQALHSSSALAVNVFDYWRDRGTAPLGEALGLVQPITGIKFEQQYRTGLPGIAPNLDVAMTLADRSTLAIESKFLEPYGAHGAGFKPKYFPDANPLWALRGLFGCQDLAERLHAGDVKFRWLNAEQLLKHILGLATSCDGAWSLGYAWYRVHGPAGEEHAAEIASFACAVESDPFAFRAWSYQDLITTMERAAKADDRDYVTYLRERYMG